MVRVGQLPEMECGGGRLIPARPVGWGCGAGEEGVRKLSSSLVWRVGGAPTSLPGSLGTHPDSKPNSYGFEPMLVHFTSCLGRGRGLLYLDPVPQFTPNWMAGDRLTSSVSP